VDANEARAQTTAAGPSRPPLGSMQPKATSTPKGNANFLSKIMLQKGLQSSPGLLLGYHYLYRRNRALKTPVFLSEWAYPIILL